jgi:hypothetical protein
MRLKCWTVLGVMLLAFPLTAAGKAKKNQTNRGMLEKMIAVPCGAKETGITGLGSVFASAGVEHVNSDEKLCPQYLLRTDEMEYQIRPTDRKHPVILPIGKEGVFKIKKDHLSMKIPDGDKKTRNYQVVSMKPVETSTDYEGDPQGKLDRPLSDRLAANRAAGKNPDNPPVKPPDPPR